MKINGIDFGQLRLKEEELLKIKNERGYEEAFACAIAGDYENFDKNMVLPCGKTVEAVAAEFLKWSAEYRGHLDTMLENDSIYSKDDIISCVIDSQFSDPTPEQVIGVLIVLNLHRKYYGKSDATEEQISSEFQKMWDKYSEMDVREAIDELHEAFDPSAYSDILAIGKDVCDETLSKAEYDKDAVSSLILDLPDADRIAIRCAILYKMCLDGELEGFSADVDPAVFVTHNAAMADMAQVTIQRENGAVSSEKADRIIRIISAALTVTAVLAVIAACVFLGLFMINTAAPAVSAFLSNSFVVQMAVSMGIYWIGVALAICGPGVVILNEIEESTIYDFCNKKLHALGKKRIKNKAEETCSEEVVYC